MVQYAEKVQYVRSFGKVSKKLEGDMTLHETMDSMVSCIIILGHGCSLNRRMSSSCLGKGCSLMTGVYGRGVPARAKARVRSQNGLDRWMS